MFDKIMNNLVKIAKQIAPNRKIVYVDLANMSRKQAINTLEVIQRNYRELHST